MPTRSYSSWIASSSARNRFPSTAPSPTTPTTCKAPRTRRSSSQSSPVTTRKNCLIVTSIQKMSNVKAGEGELPKPSSTASPPSASYSSLTSAIDQPLATCSKTYVKHSPMRCSSASRERRFLTRTRRRAPRQPWCSANACTDTASPTAFATAMCWVLTPTW